MELSIPITNYPGRGGNSKPFILNYSSKVWNMKMFNTRSQTLQVSNQAYDFIVHQSTEIRPTFAERSVAGWTSSLQPAIIYDESLSEVYNEFGYLYTGQVPGGLLSLSNLVDGDGCYWTEPELVYNATCGGLAWHSNYRCLGDDGSWHNAGAQNYECVTGGSIFNPGGPGPWTPGSPQPPSYVPQIPHIVKRTTVVTPDGATHEFRKSDKAYNCNNEPTECYDSSTYSGTYLSVDGSGLRLVRGQSQFGAIRDVIYFPDGSKYLFVPYTQPGQQPSTVRPMIVDANGNKSVYEQDATWKDTLGREIQDPFNDPDYVLGHSDGQSQDLKVKGLNGQAMSYSLSWEKLEDVFEDPVHMKTQLSGADNCTTPEGDPVNDPYLFENQTPGPLDDQIINRTRYLVFHRTCANRSANGQLIEFNPVVVSQINLPNGKNYEFKYNEYGEIAKIIYPTGGWERFEYGYVNPIGFSALEVYQQANRGVLKKYVSFDGTTEEQEWTYQQQSPTVITIAPDGSRTEKDIWEGYGSGFGFEDPRNGMVKEERVKDTNGVLHSRTINELKNTAPRDNGVGERDPKLTRSVTIVFEPGSSAALATLGEVEYDDVAGPDSTYFSHLNVHREKSYHYAVISDKTTVDNENLSWETIAGWFPSNKVASITETDYSYSATYRALGIIKMPVESRVLNPANTSEVLSKTQFYYDGTLFNESGTPASGWDDPGSTTPRGNVTFSRTLLKDPVTQSESWIGIYAEFDKFGNLRKAWDAAGNLTETQYGSDYGYAYPTKVIAPAPDSTNTHGTNQTSSAETTYDFTTGLVKSVKNDYGQITKTEYNDTLLRQTRVYADNFTGPETQMIYDDNARTIKVRKQLDETNWDEGTTYMDQAGRPILTQAKDSQGDVYVNTHYDLMGRVDCVTKPYRSGEAAYWNKTRFDEVGRTVESYAPIAVSLCQTQGQTLQSLGTTSFDISTVANYEGSVVISNDTSGRKTRSITNAVGQLLRIDEPTAFGGTVTADLGAIGTPNQPTYYTYSKLGKMVKVQQGKTGETIQYRYFLYDNLGRLLRVKQPEQEANTGLAFTDSISGNSSWSAKFTYDVQGNVLTATDAKGTVITNAYDNAGRVKTRSYSNEPQGITTPAVDYFYDGKGLSGTANFAKGKLTRISSSVSETRYTDFDHMGRALSSEQVTDGQTYPIRYKYNLSGALTEETYPSGEVVRNFVETDGDLSRVAVSGKTYISDFTYTASGGIFQLKLGNGRWETAQVNSRLQVTQLGLGTAPNDTSLWKANYEYGELQTNGTVDTAKNTGNMAKQTLTIPGTSFVQTYKYDSLYRLTEAKETTSSSQNWIQSFSYDRFGNRTGFNQQIGSLTVNTTPSVDANTNRFNSAQGFLYDKNGNITQDGQAAGVRTFIFDGENKQTQVKDLNGNPVGTYFYDGMGKRVKKVNSSETTIFVYDGTGKLIAEYSNQAVQNPTISYTTADHLDTPRVITDKNGNVSSRRDFMPFGEELNAGTPNRVESAKYALTGDSLRKKFTGYEKDAETGFDFAEARYYNNRHGRFTAVDPLLASGKSVNPQTFNRYIYTSNNPVMRVDRNGLDWYKEPCGVQNGAVVYRPVWKPHNSNGNRWHEAGSLTYENKSYDVKGESFAFKDVLTGKYWAFDFYENRPGASFGSLEEAKAQTAAWERQVGINLIAGFLSVTSFSFDIAGGSKSMGAEEGSEAYQIGQRAGIGFTVVSLFTGGGLINAAINKVAKGGLSIFKGLTVLGHNPKYLEVAERLGANVFSIPKKIWDKMTETEQWAANTAFLDDAIASGHSFILATPLRDGPSWFRREVNYLLEHGYVYNADKTKLIPRAAGAP